MSDQSHPAPFSVTIMDVLADLIADWPGPILDPYAGIGRVHELGRDDTWGIEIEREFADSQTHRRTVCADSSTARPYDPRAAVQVGFFAVTDPWAANPVQINQPRALVFSPDYGNRFADQYLGTPEEQRLRAEEGIIPRRRSYAISLGRTVTPGSTCRYKFGPLYRQGHTRIMTAVTGVCLPNARLACNVSDFLETEKKGEPPRRVHVVAFWVEMLASLGWVVERLIPVTTSRYRDGANSDLRVDNETIIVAHHTGGQE